MDRNRLARHLVQSSLAYYEAALWKRFLSSDLVAVHVPGHEQPVLVSIMDAAGGHGLCVFRGDSALRSARHWVSSPGTEETASETDLVALSFHPVADLPAEFQVLLREAKFSGSLAPDCIAKPPGRHARPTNRHENELLLWLVQGLLAADAAGLLRPIAPNFGRRSVVIWTLRLSGKPLAPEVRAKFEEYALDHDAAAALPAEVTLPDDLCDLPCNGSSWWIAVPLMHATIEGDDRELKAVLVFDETADVIVAIHPVLEVDPVAVAQVLFAACRDEDDAGARGLPSRLACDRQDLHAALAPALAAAGVDVALVPEIADARKILAEFAQFHGGPEAGAPAQQALLDEWPEDDDLRGWKRIDVQVSDLFAARATRDDKAVRKAVRRWFGQDREFLEGDGEMAMACFAEWFACCRAREDEQSPAELMRADESLPAAVRHVMSERAGAPIELWRVTSVTRGEGVELAKVLGTRRVFVTDQSMSLTAPPGTTLFAKVYRVGAFHFLAALSAPLGDVDRTLHFLEQQGLDLDGEELADTAHALGRLWAYRAATAGRPPHLVNTDGDELLDVRASFAVRDEAALRRALLRRQDVDAAGDEEDDATSRMVWLGRDRGDQGRTILGELEFVGGELVARVNSEQRLQRLLRWLPGLPGIGKQLGVTRGELTDAPVDDRLGPRPDAVPPTAEMLAAVREHMRAHYRRWLDEPLPVLGGKTPRQAARTAAGRQKVARLIRTTPDPEGPAGPLSGAVPREEMLRELGLEDEAAAGS